MQVSLHVLFSVNVVIDCKYTFFQLLWEKKEIKLGSSMNSNKEGSVNFFVVLYVVSLGGAQCSAF